jgi:bifunctional aspartokinase / homoserine dehydrogenase 1
LRSVCAEEFLNELDRHDQRMSELHRAARARERVLRYVGVVEAGGQLSAGLREYAGDHPFANLKGGDNIVSFQTGRYNAEPLIVRGPGAGPEVTAAGVFADLLRLASFLGAPL